MIVSLYPKGSGNVTSWRLENINFQIFWELQSSDIVRTYNEKSD